MFGIIEKSANICTKYRSNANPNFVDKKRTVTGRKHTEDLVNASHDTSDDRNGCADSNSNNMQLEEFD